MKKIRLFPFILAALLIFASCSSARLQTGDSNGSSQGSGAEGSESTGGKAGPGIAETKEEDEATASNGSGQPDKNKGYDWTIRVNDTQEGTLEIPQIGSIKGAVMLDLVAYKDGGESPYGDYEGEGYITVNLDLEGLSNEEYLYQGFANWNRYCEKFEVKLVEYDLNTYVDKTPSKILVQPLVNYDTMGISQSKWADRLSAQTTITDRESGQSRTVDNTGEDTAVKMGVHMRVGGEVVIIEIPTYSIVYKGVNFFKGTLAKAPLGERDREQLPEPSLPNYDSNQENDRPPSTPSSPDESEPNALGEGQFYQDDEGNLYFDTDGNGTYDYYMDESGDMHMDTDGDGVYDTVIEGEYSDG